LRKPCTKIEMPVTVGLEVKKQVMMRGQNPEYLNCTVHTNIWQFKSSYSFKVTLNTEIVN